VSAESVKNVFNATVLGSWDNLQSL